MQCPRGTKRDDDGGREKMRQLCLAPTGPMGPFWARGRFLYSPVGDTIASSSVYPVVCLSCHTGEQGAWSFQCVLDSVGGLLSSPGQGWVFQVAVRLAMLPALVS